MPELLETNARPFQNACMSAKELKHLRIHEILFDLFKLNPRTHIQIFFSDLPVILCLVKTKFFFNSIKQICHRILHHWLLITNSTLKGQRSLGRVKTFQVQVVVILVSHGHFGHMKVKCKIGFRREIIAFNQIITQFINF